MKKNFGQYHVISSTGVICQTAVHFHRFDWTATQIIVRTLLETALKSQSDQLLSALHAFLK